MTMGRARGHENSDQCVVDDHGEEWSGRGGFMEAPAKQLTKAIVQTGGGCCRDDQCCKTSA